MSDLGKYDPVRVNKMFKKQEDRITELEDENSALRELLYNEGWGDKTISAALQQGEDKEMRLKPEHFSSITKPSEEKTVQRKEIEDSVAKFLAEGGVIEHPPKRTADEIKDLVRKKTKQESIEIIRAKDWARKEQNK